MAPMSEQWTMHVNLPAHESLRLCQAHCEGRSARCTTRSESTQIFSAGSQLALRLKGGLLSNLDDFPIQIEIRANPRSDGLTDVTVVVRDSLGFGLKTGMRKKYAEALSKWSTGLRTVLTPHIAAPMAPTAPTVAPELIAPGGTIADALRELEQLRQDGVLSDAEFAATKKKLLGI